MKYVKMLGLLAVAAAAMMAFAGIASATVTSPAGSVYSGELGASSSNTSLDGSVKVACSNSTVSGNVAGGGTEEEVESLTFTECGKDTVAVLDPGKLKIHSNGTVTSSGAEVTVQLHRSVLGFPVTTHCIYSTNATDVGTLTENVSPAVLHIGSSPIPEVPTDGACGNDAVWTGTYTVNTPSSAIVID